jgi:hypothetical protein
MIPDTKNGLPAMAQRCRRPSGIPCALFSRALLTQHSAESRRGNAETRPYEVVPDAMWLLTVEMTQWS